MLLHLLVIVTLIIITLQINLQQILTTITQMKSKTHNNNNQFNYLNFSIKILHNTNNNRKLNNNNSFRYNNKMMR